MSALFRLLINIISSAFVFWAIWAAYALYRNGWKDLETVSLSFLLVAFLALTCTYLITAAIQDNVAALNQQVLNPQKAQLYQQLIEKGISYFYTERNAQTEQAFQEALLEAKTQLLVQSKLNVLTAFNSLRIVMQNKAPLSTQQEAFVKLILAMRLEAGQQSAPAKRTVKSLLEGSAP